MTTPTAGDGTVRAATMQLLRELGMTTVFSNPSLTEMKLFENWPDDIRFVMGLQEATVVAMADGYAQATGVSPLVIVNGGAGLGNAMGSVYNASGAHTPMVIIGGQQGRRMMLGEPFLKARDATLLPQPYVKWTGEPARPQDVPELLLKAFHIANQAPKGPVFVSIPEDDWVRPAAEVPVVPRRVRNAVSPDQEALTELAAALNAAERPALVAGPAVETQGARQDLVALAERLNATVYGSPAWPRASFPETHPRFGRHLPPIPAMISEILSGHDVVAVLGGPAFTLITSMDLFATHPADLDSKVVWDALPEGTTILHVTDDPEQASWSIASTTYVCPPGAAVRGLVPLIEPRGEAAEPVAREEIPVPEATEPLTQAYLFHTLAQELPPDAAVFEELPIDRTYFHEQIHLGPGNDYFASTTGALGFPFAGAVGYAMARPDRRTVAVVGEGSAQYTLHALWTAAKHNLPVTFVIPDNAGYVSLKISIMEQEKWRSGWDLTGVDTAAIAQGFGCPAERVETASQLQEALKRSFTVDGPVLLDVMIAGPEGIHL
ncbi:benzoylformate decarboxylase [Actinomadura barringtoniae]|uniref:Benzoylformate decarboxylase n=1 Tax=Actinomadura barringtoniae TaxID=1427535 RepID=A0A939PAT3_9ACTN|nr:benzoylformate decarboxylase [Actinomadura barringtoniae]MBO2448742.1 benzoylformate decarboxylase [Actinomadura barringtoniae]